MGTDTGILKARSEDALFTAAEMAASLPHGLRRKAAYVGVTDIHLAYVMRLLWVVFTRSKRPQCPVNGP